MSQNAPHRHGKRADRSPFSIPESSVYCSSVIRAKQNRVQATSLRGRSASRPFRLRRLLLALSDNSLKHTFTPTLQNDYITFVSKLLTKQTKTTLQAIYRAVIYTSRKKD